MSAQPLAQRLIEPAECAQEPIRIPGSVQPYGVLLALDPSDRRIVQVGAGTERAPFGPDTLGRTLDECLPASAARVIDDLVRIPEQGATYLCAVPLGEEEDAPLFHVIGHRSGAALVIEFEESVPGETRSFEDLYPDVRSLLDRLQGAATMEEVGAIAAHHVRSITGFDRVLIYRFDPQWNGQVIAEDGNGVLPSLMHHRFPAADIPAQARELYRTNRLRIIPDADYAPVPIEPRINPLTNAPLDLGAAVLRSVSPIHLEFMRNMGTWASMSISLMRAGELWGLISCHSRDARRVPYHVRTACDFIGQVLSLQIGTKEETIGADHRIRLRGYEAQIMGSLANEERFIDGLVASADALLALVDAGGAAILFEGTCSLLGETPGEAEVQAIAEWLGRSQTGDIYHTDNLAGSYEGGERIKDVASGLLAVSISQLHASYVLWFRPERIRTVEWAGDPRKTEPEPGQRLHPRLSFETWKETVRLTSEPWLPAQIDAAMDLRTAVVDIVLRKAEEMAALNEQLVRSNRELEAFSYSVSHDLRAPFRHIVGYSELLKQSEGDKLSERGQRYVATIIDSAVAAGTLVDSLLGFSQMGRVSIEPKRVDMNMLVTEMQRRLELEAGDRPVEWIVGDLPNAWGDPAMLRLVYQNLLGNALKFTRHREHPRIEVSSMPGDGETIYYVRDNGAGFNMAYVNKLFGVFQRLHHSEEFEGTGIGLANVRRIVERHGGRTWAEGAVDQGATLYFSLPIRGTGK